MKKLLTLAAAALLASSVANAVDTSHWYLVGEQGKIVATDGTSNPNWNDTNKDKFAFSDNGDGTYSWTGSIDGEFKIWNGQWSDNSSGQGYAFGYGLNDTDKYTLAIDKSYELYGGAGQKNLICHLKNITITITKLNILPSKDSSSINIEVKKAPNPKLNIESNRTYVFFDNSSSKWDNVCIHYWGNGESKWPGIHVTEYDVNGKDLFVFSFDSTKCPTGFIFNNGDNGKQTNDITKFENIVWSNGNNTKTEFVSGHVSLMDPSSPEYIAYNTALKLTTNEVDLNSEEGKNHEAHVAVHHWDVDENGDILKHENGDAVDVVGEPFEIVVTGKDFAWFNDIMKDYDKDKLKDYLNITIEPGEWKSLHTFIGGCQNVDDDGKWIPNEDGTYDYIWTEAPISLEYTDFEVTDNGIRSEVLAEVGGDYKVTVDFKGYSQNLVEGGDLVEVLKPTKVTADIKVKPTAKSLGLGLRYLGGFDKEGKENNTVILKTTYTDKDGKTYTPDYSKVYFSTAAHIPTRNIKFYYYQIPQSTESGQANVKRRANETGAPEGYTEAGKDYLDFSHINGVQSGKVLSVVAEQNGVKSDPIDFKVADDIVTAVEGVEVEGVEAPARYFTLQGVEVSNLVPGIYIMVKGNVSSKILVK